MRIPSIAMSEVAPMLQAFGQFNRQLITITELVQELHRVVHFSDMAAFALTDYDLLSLLDDARHDDPLAYLGNARRFEFYLRPRCVCPTDGDNRMAFDLIALPATLD